MAGNARPNRQPWSAVPLFTGLAILVCLALPGSAQALSVHTDVSDRTIRITSGFTGARVIVFGSASTDLIRDRSDIVIVVRGPTETAVVRRKDRVLGIWINRETEMYDYVPQFYAVASNRALAAIAEPEKLQRLEIGASNIRFDRRPVDQTETVDPDRLKAFREALIRRNRSKNLYQTRIGDVEFPGGGLFRTEFYLPAIVPVGTYLVTVHVFNDGQLTGRQTVRFDIGKYGIERDLFSLAHERPLIYGFASVITAWFVGWLASVVFRRG